MFIELRPYILFPQYILMEKVLKIPIKSVQTTFMARNFPLNLIICSSFSFFPFLSKVTRFWSSVPNALSTLLNLLSQKSSSKFVKVFGKWVIERPLIPSTNCTCFSCWKNPWKSLFWDKVWFKLHFLWELS